MVPWVRIVTAPSPYAALVLPVAIGGWKGTRQLERGKQWEQLLILNHQVLCYVDFKSERKKSTTNLQMHLILALLPE